MSLPLHNTLNEEDEVVEQATRICKICGKEYPYCRTEAAGSENRWQDVGCCIEHATQYFKEVAIARGELPAEEKQKPTKAEEKKEDKRDLKGDKNAEDKIKE